MSVVLQMVNPVPKDSNATGPSQLSGVWLRNPLPPAPGRLWPRAKLGPSGIQARTLGQMNIWGPPGVPGLRWGTLIILFVGRGLPRHPHQVPHVILRVLTPWFPNLTDHLTKRRGCMRVSFPRPSPSAS